MKRSSYLTRLSHDHHAGLVFAKGLLKRVAEPEPVEALSEEITAFWRKDLMRHFSDEEQYLIPHLDSLEATDLTDRLRREHSAIRTAVDSFTHAPASGDQIREFADLLLAHIRWEERELFPELEQRLPESTLMAISDQLSGH